MSESQKATLALFIAACIWGFNPFMSKLLLPYGTPLTFVCLRFFISSTTILLFLIYKKRLTIPTPSMIFKLFLLGLFSVCFMNTALLTGLQYSTVINIGVINALSPVIIAVLTRIVYKEKLFRLQWIGVFLGLLGTVCVITNGSIFSIFTMRYNFGDFLFLFAQVSWAIYTLISWGIRKQISLLELVMWSGYFGVFENVLFGYLTGQLSMPIFNITSSLSLAYSAWLSAMSGMLLWNYGVKYKGPNIAAVYVNLTTLVTITSGIIFLGEALTFGKIMGIIAVIMGALFLTQYAHLHSFFQKKFYK